jgi:hypothetical protein
MHTLQCPVWGGQVEGETLHNMVLTHFLFLWRIMIIGKVVAVGLASGKTCLYHYRDGSLIRKLEPTLTISKGNGGVDDAYGSHTKMGSVDFLRWDPLDIGKSKERIFPLEVHILKRRGSLCRSPILFFSRISGK